MKIHAVLVCAGLLCAGQSSAQMGGGMGGGRGGGDEGFQRQRPVFPSIDRETMILSTPEDWHSTQPLGNENKVDLNYFPEGEDHSEWTETLREEIYRTTAGMESADRVYELRSVGDSKNCPNYTSEIREQEPENGYSMIVWRQSCQPSEELTFSSLHKVVLGNDRLYILNKIWKYEPSNRIWRRWEDFFEGIYVCDPNRPEHGCRPLPQDPGNATGGGGRSAL